MRGIGAGGANLGSTHPKTHGYSREMTRYSSVKFALTVDAEHSGQAKELKEKHVRAEGTSMLCGGTEGRDARRYVFLKSTTSGSRERKHRNWTWGTDLGSTLIR